MTKRASSTAASILLLTASMGLVPVIVCGWHLMSSAESARTAALGAEESQTLAKRIVQLRQKPQRAAFVAESDLDIGALVSAHVEELGIPAGVIRGVTPSSPRRTQRESPYLLRETRVEFGPMPPKTLVKLLYGLADEIPSLTITQIQMTPPLRPSPDKKDDRWISNITLTQLVYSPIKQAL